MKTRTKRKVRQGLVTSALHKTISVSIKRSMQHPLYKKIFKMTSIFKAHDETSQCHVGDLVEIMETRPISKTKHWRVVAIKEKAKEKVASIADIEGLPDAGQEKPEKVSNSEKEKSE